MGNMELTGEMKNPATGDAPSAPEREIAVVASDAPEQQLAGAPDVSDAPEQQLGASTPGDAARPTVIVMHASVGSGHRSAANAVAQALRPFAMASPAPRT